MNPVVSNVNQDYILMKGQDQLACVKVALPVNTQLKKVWQNAQNVWKVSTALYLPRLYKQIAKNVKEDNT